MTAPVAPSVAAPNAFYDSTHDSTHEVQLRALLRRHLTRAGTIVALPVTATLTSLTVSLLLSEENASYGVTVTPNWNTTVWVTGKTTTQCTINFGTMAPANATVDIDTFRSL